MNLGTILVIVGGLVAGYWIVSVLMNTSADDLRPPPKPGEAPPRAAESPRLLEAPRQLEAPRRLEAPRGYDWPLLLDIPRSASARDIEAAFRRQQSKAEAARDQAMLEQLRLAREAALAEKKA